MRKIVIFDLLFAQPIERTMFHGGGEYMKTVFKALANNYDGSYDFGVCYDTERFLDDWVVSLIREKNLQIIHVKKALDIVNTVSCKAQNADVRFFAGMIYPYADVRFHENVVCIGTCHGLRSLEKPYDSFAPLYIQNIKDMKGFAKYTLLKKRAREFDLNKYANALERFHIIITDSDHSMYSIKLNFPELIKNKDVRAFYAPAKYMEYIEPENENNSEPYIMMISANRWLKNSYRGVKALDGLYQQGFLNGIKTKVYGNLPKQIKRNIKCKECFDFLDYVSSEELERAYKNCTVFFYPTLNEGFGLPPMEAMKYGKTCVISNVCSLPEIYGEAVYYCNPYDIMEMQNRILQATDSPIEQSRIRDRLGRIREKQYTDLVQLCRLISG